MSAISKAKRKRSIDDEDGARCPSPKRHKSERTIMPLDSNGKNEQSNGAVSSTNVIIKLQVGERKFITTKSTLTQHGDSNYFAKLFNGPFDSSPTM